MTSKSTNHYNRLNWEDAEFAILCETCLGVNPFIRMTKEKYGKECKICTRPFTVFRWCPGKGMRFKTTQICQTCSKMKNVCQTCVFDLDYGLPVEVRDAALNIKENVPKEGVNREYYTQNARNELALENPGQTLAKFDATSSEANPMLKRLQRNDPYYKRNLPHICSFWVKGSCNRGEACPYRHEKPSDPDDPLSVQNIKDRYYGSNDPVATKLMKQYNSLPSLKAPEDLSIMSIFVSNVDNSILEKDLQSYFYQFGEIVSIVMVYLQKCAFVNFADRKSAQLAIDSCSTGVEIKGILLTLKWGKSIHTKIDDGVVYAPVPGLPAPLNPINSTPIIAPPLPSESGEKRRKYYYPSQDPNNQN